jgi:hypothetical protein
MNIRYPLLLGIVLLAIIFPNTDLFSQCSYDCKTDVTIQVPESGTYALQPADLMTVDPEGCVPFDRLFVVPAEVTCDDAGKTIDYEIRVDGTNFLLCTGQVQIGVPEDAVVYAKDSVTLALAEDENDIALTAELLVDSIVGGGCAGANKLIVQPAEVDCSDVGRPVNYTLSWEGSNQIVATGTIEVLDLTPPQVTVVDSFFLYLEEDDTEIRVRPELLVVALNDNCLRFGDLAVEPAFVDCTDANRDQPFTLYDAVRGDTLGTGILAVRDTFAATLQCRDTIRLTYPNNGFPVFLRPSDVILDFADNCIDPSNMIVTPGVLDCDALDTLTNYHLQIRDSGDELCSGVIELIDESLPELTCVGDTILELPAGLDTLTWSAADLITSFRDNCLDVEDMWVVPDLTFTCSSVGDTIDYVIYTPDSTALCGGTIYVRNQPSDTLICSEQVTVDLPVDTAVLDLGLGDVLANFDSLSCPTLTDLSLSLSSVDCGDLGSDLPYLVTSTTRGDTLCTGTITVRDTTPPVFTCMDSVVVYQLEDGSTIPLTADLVISDFSDNCMSVDDLQLTTPSVPCFIGDANLDYEVLMPGGDTLCTGVLVIRDTFPPSFQCVDTLRRVLPTDGSPVTLQAADAINQFSDNCFDLNDLFITPDELDCTSAGDTTLTYSVRIVPTNERVCSGILEIIDNSEPVITCVDTFRLSLAADGTAPAPELSDLMTSFADNCGTPDDLNLSVADTFNCADQAIPQTYDIQLADGRSACSGIILVGDQTAPVVTCRPGPVDVFLAEGSDILTLSADQFVTSFGDNCANTSSLEIVPKQVSCSFEGDTLDYAIRWTFTGEVLCQGQFVVRDTFQPAPVCRDTVVYSLPAFDDNSRLGIEDIILEVNDNCATFTEFALDLPEPDCDDGGSFLPYNLTYRASGDTLCRGIVQVIDDVDLNITCKTQAEFTIPSGDVPPVLFPETVIADFSDNCTRISDLRLDPMRYSCDDVGQPMPYTLRIADTDETVCTGTITIVERAAPVVACKESITVELTDSDNVLDIAPGDVITSIQEDCTPIFDLGASITPSNVDCDDAGLMLPYTVTVTDASGNKGRCNGVITVLDDLAPEAVCKDSVTVTLSNDGFEFPNPRILDAGSFDNCNSTFQLNYRMSPSLFNCDDIGQTFETKLRVRDRAGNESTCTSYLTVEGPENPMTVEIIPPANLDCNSVAVFRANVQNAGFFQRYNWVVEEGSERGWRIVSSRSGQSVQVATGEGAFKLSVSVETIGGCTATDSVEETCESGAGGVIVTSVGDQTDDQPLELFPNPTDGRLQVVLPGWQGEVRYRILNLQGMVVQQTGDRFVDIRDDLDVTNLPAGTYLLSVERAGAQPISKTFVKQ